MDYILKELRRHRWRTIAGISGYLIATMFILLVTSVSLTGKKDSTGILKGTGTHFIVYIPTNASCCVSCDTESSNGSLIAEGVYTLMLNSDLIESIKEIEGVKDAAPYLLYRIYDENLKSEVSLGGIDTTSVATSNNVCASANLIDGKYFTGSADDVVVEESFAMAHKVSVGDTLKTYGGKLAVTGIVNSGIKPGKADLYAPIENVRRILKEKMKCISSGFDMNIVVVEVTSARLQPSVIRQIREEMGYLSLSSYNCYQPAGEVMNILEGTSAILSALIFFFMIVFAAKTQLTSLMERSREVGILKSLGWSNSRLSTQIVAISSLQALIGSLAGAVAGLVVIQIMNSGQIRFPVPFQFDLQTGRTGLLILLSVAGGLVASIFPILKLHRTKAGDLINNFI